MLALTILSIFIFIVFLIIFLEYRNEKRYQEKRRSQSQQKRTPRKKLKVKKVAPKPEAKPEAKPEPILSVEQPKEVKRLPQANYPAFSHMRLVEMGLSDDEAKEFVAELIPQLEIQIPLIEEAMNIPDFHQMERLTHSIKGSATNIGTGGVSALLVDCNTYLKTGTDIDIAKAYFKHLVHYTAELKKQYS